jgi:hypothetical protein
VNDVKPYEFNSKVADGQSIVHAINLLLGDNIVGAEIGVFKGHTFCTLLQNCPKITKLIAVDSYKPYTDFLKEPYDGTPAYTIDAKDIDFIRLTAMHNIAFSGYADKVLFLQQDSSEAAKQIEDESLDFVFLDTYMTLEQAEKDLVDWYGKVKKRGLFSGHDWTSTAIQQAVNNFRKSNNIDSFMSTFDNTWIWRK